MAEAVFAHLVKEKGLSHHFEKIDSFGTTGYHVGDSPDYRTMQVLKDHNIQYRHRAQKLSKADFDKFDYLFGMDLYHVSTMKRMSKPGSRAKVQLYGEFNDASLTGMDDDIADPWYDSDMSGFEECYRQVTYFGEQFLKSLGLE